jgi:hypothetical protein
MKTIKDIPDKNPFRVPENYFEEVNRKILAATCIPVRVEKRSGIFLRYRTWFSVAASVAGLILLTYAAVRVISPGKDILRHAEIISNEYNEAYINDIDLITLEKSVTSDAFYEETPEVSNKEIIDYLLLENIELSDIYAQL